MSGKLVIALPSKGRLQDMACALFERAGLRLAQARGERGYRAAIDGLPDVDVAYLTSSEIAAQLAAGSAHLGITGEDLVRETIARPDEKLALLAPLGFGQADVVVAVPTAWIDVRSMAGLEDAAAMFHARRGKRMRVATKYVNLTRAFFAAHGVADYRIVESLGATEGAPAGGAAELIVDITTTGATLAANGLKLLEDGLILKSQANLAASLTARWSKTQRQAAAHILARLAAEQRARTTREVRASLAGAAAAIITEAIRRFDASAPHGLNKDMLVLHCPAAAAAGLAEWLIGKGASAVTVSPLDYVFSAANPLQERLDARLK